VPVVGRIETLGLGIAEEREGFSRLPAWPTCGVDPEWRIAVYRVQRRQCGALGPRRRAEDRVATFD
jgi:hypothetical protein